MRSHIDNSGRFQSDKYPSCPPDKVPLSVKDPTAQDLLAEYARRRRPVDAEFSADLEYRLHTVGYQPRSSADVALMRGLRDNAETQLAAVGHLGCGLPEQFQATIALLDRLIIEAGR